MDLLFALLSYALLWALSWWAAIGRGWGQAESAHDPASRWLYARRLLLIGLSLAGVVVVGESDLASYGWGLSWWLLLAFGLGLVLAQGNRGGFVIAGPLPLLLAMFHTFATELYFRGYLYHHLNGAIGWIALPLSALFYGAYYLTVHTVWVGGRRGRIAGFGLFTLLGFVFAGFYALSGGFLAAWLCHFGAVLRWKKSIVKASPSPGSAR
jgi:hypothetical protein